MAPWTWESRSAAHPSHKAYAFGTSRVVSPSSLDGHLSKYSKYHEAVCTLDITSGNLRPSLSDSLAGAKSPAFQDALRALPPPLDASTGISVCTKWYFTLVTLPECLGTPARTKALQFLKRNAHSLLRKNYGVRQDEAEKGVRAMPINSDQNYVLVATDSRLVAGRHRAALHSLTESPAFRTLLNPPPAPAKPITLTVQSMDNPCVPPSWEAVSAALEPYGSLLKMRRGREGIIACSVAPGAGSHVPPLTPVALSTTEVSNNPFITSGSHKIAISATISHNEVSDIPAGEAHADVASAEGLSPNDGALAPSSEESTPLTVHTGPTDLMETPKKASPHDPEAVLPLQSVTPPANTLLAASPAPTKQPLSEVSPPPTRQLSVEQTAQIAAIVDAISRDSFQLSNDGVSTIADFISDDALDQDPTLNLGYILQAVSGKRATRANHQWIDRIMPVACKHMDKRRDRLREEAHTASMPSHLPKDDPVESPLPPPAPLSGLSASANQPTVTQKRSPRPQSSADPLAATNSSPSGVSPPQKKPKP